MHHPLALVGRERELARARDWLGRVRSGPGALVVRGEPGVGKTALWDAVVATAGEQGATVLVCRAVEAEMPLGYAGLGDLLEPVAADAVAGLSEPLSSDLATALLLRPSDRPAAPLGVARATFTALRALAASTPVVIAVDDVQWLDPASARVLSFAVRRFTAEPVGLLLSLRERHADPLGCAATLGDRAEEVTLAGLGLGPLAHLLRVRVDPQTSRRRVQRIHERSAGNPLFALHLARTPTADRLPESLREVVAGRLDRVDRRATSAIEVAAVVCPAPPTAFDDPGALAAAMTAGVLVDDGGVIRFSHPLLGAEAYSRLDGGRRRALHEQAMAAATNPEARGRHLALATEGTDAAAAALLDDAARWAAARGAPEAAAELASHAHRLTPVDDLDQAARRQVDRVDYLMLSGDEQGARLVVDEVLASDATGAVRVRALVHSALLAADPQAAVAQLEQAVALPIADQRLRARTLAQLAWQRGAWLGDVDRAYEESVLAVAMAESARDDSALCSALTTAGLMGTFARQPGSETYLERALAFASHVPRSAADPSPRVAYAHVLWWRGAWNAAARLLADERVEAERRGDEALLMRLDLFGAEFEMRRGHWPEATELLASAIGDARDYWRAMTLLQRALLRARQGDPGAAADAAEVAASVYARGEPVIAAAAEFALGLVAYGEEDTARAAELVVALPRRIEGSRSRALEFAFLIPDAVAVLVADGRTDDAEQLTQQLADRCAQLGPHGAASVDLCHGLVRLAHGDTELALEPLASARAGFEALAAPWELAQALVAEGSALRRMGRRRDAAAALDRAVAVLTDLGAEPATRRAVRELGRARPRPRSDNAPTAAERRVALLVVEGLTNKQVAARLFTSVATVEAHLTRLYVKAGVRSRTQLVREIAEGRLEVETDDAEPGV